MLDTTTFILTMIFSIVIASFIFRLIVRSAIDSSRLMKKVEQLEHDLAELRSNNTL